MGPQARTRTGGAMGAWLALCAAAVSGCGGDASVQPSKTGADLSATAVKAAYQQGTAVNPAIVTADNSFGLGLFNTLNQGDSGNVAISPISVALALHMAYNGAAGATQQAMAQALQVQALSSEDIDSDDAALQASLIDPDPKVEITVANSLWMHLGGNPVRPSFTQVNQTYYAAQIGDLAGAPDNVNAWISNATNGLITQVLPSDNYALVAVVIANAIYFKGAWSTAFDPSMTSTASFTLSDGTVATCEMMRQSGSFPYYQGSNYQAIRLPYGQDKRISMFILLPDAEVNIKEFVVGLSAAALDSLDSQLQAATVNVALPRFTSSYSNSLVSALTALGMGVAFTRQADFSGIAPGLQITKVQHAAVVAVDETGTTAAAATTVTVGVTVVAPSLLMTMDHPFFYTIRDDDSGALLFIGVLMNPSQGV
jgi:serine protease inhibitor